MAVMGVTIGCAQPYAIYMSSLLCRFAGYYVLRQVRVIWYEDRETAVRWSAVGGSASGGGRGWVSVVADS